MSDTFSRVVKAVELAIDLLFEGDFADSFELDMNPGEGRVVINDCVIHTTSAADGVASPELTRVTCGANLVFSTENPEEAVIEALVTVIAARTKEALREQLREALG